MQLSCAINFTITNNIQHGRISHFYTLFGTYHFLYIRINYFYIVIQVLSSRTSIHEYDSRPCYSWPHCFFHSIPVLFDPKFGVF